MIERRGFLKMFGAAAVAAAVPQSYANGGLFKPSVTFGHNTDSGVFGVALADGQAGEIIPVAIMADPGDEQFQILNTFGEFVDRRFEDITPGDIVRKARNPEQQFRVIETRHDANPPSFVSMDIR